MILLLVAVQVCGVPEFVTQLAAVLLFAPFNVRKKQALSRYERLAPMYK
jgi:hypothetical protein